MHLSLGGPQSERPPGHGCSLHWPLPLVAKLPRAQFLARNCWGRGITPQGRVIHEKLRNKVMIRWRFLPGRSRRRMTKIIQKNILASLLHLTENKKTAWTNGRNSVSESPGIPQVDRQPWLWSHTTSVLVPTLPLRLLCDLKNIALPL